MTNDVTEVTAEQFERITVLLDRARQFEEASRGDHLTLAQKLGMKGHAKLLRDQAMAIGRVPVRPSHEAQGTSYDSGAAGYERQGRKNK